MFSMMGADSVSRLREWFTTPRYTPAEAIAGFAVLGVVLAVLKGVT